MRGEMLIQFPELELQLEEVDRIVIPPMYRIIQKYDDQQILDVSGHLRRELETSVPHREQLRGKRLALTVGSRGIPDLDKLVRTICDTCKAWGAEPFIVPAMGSHGGSTAEGQRKILEEYGITAETMGVPVCSSMETVQYGALEDGTPLYCDKNAWEADGVILFNKVKPHTDFRGKHESGLGKMVAIGLAKEKGASMFHTKPLDRFPEYIPKVTELFMATGKVAFGVGVVQNAYDRICRIEACGRDDILEMDARLQAFAKTQLPRFKFDRCDVLVVDEIGKDISGSGMDPNITGRNDSGDFPEVLDLQRLVVLGITEASCHNGCGINLCDLTVRRCLNEIDWHATWLNNVAASMLSRGQIPIYVETDRDAVRTAIRTCVGIDFHHPRVARIKNTLHMSEILVSADLYQDIKDREDVVLVSGPEEMAFDANGFLRKDIWGQEVADP